MDAAHQFQDLGRPGRSLGGVANGAALHEQDRLQAVPPHQGGRQAQHVASPHLPENRFKGGGSDVVAFVDDHLPVALHHRVHLSLPHQ